MLKVWGLYIKGLQSYQLSKLKVSRKSLPLGPGPTQTSRPGFEFARDRIILKGSHTLQMICLQFLQIKSVSQIHP